MKPIIAKVQESQLRKDHPVFRPGDTIRVNVRLKEGEGDKERIQPFEGVVMSRRGELLGESFHGATRELRHRRRADFPGAFADDQLDRRGAAGPRAAREAELSARAQGQGRTHQARRAKAGSGRRRRDAAGINRET